MLEDNKTKEEVSESENSTIHIDHKFDEIITSINENNFKQMEKVNTSIDKLTSGLNHILDGMKSELAAVKDIALEKEVKIQRYEEGYDQKNIKAFVKDLLRILDFANNNKETSNIVNEIYEDLTILLENEGVEKINLNVGEHYDGNAKVVKIISTKDIDDMEKNNVVYEIKKEGYFLEIAEDQIKIIRPSEIILYKYKKDTK